MEHEPILKDPGPALQSPDEENVQNEEDKGKILTWENPI